MFASLASKKDLIYKNIASIPFDYLEIIEQIMTAEGWKICFSKLIDIQKYYNKQHTWEIEFGREMQNYLENKKVQCDFSTGYFSVFILQEEINAIFSNFEEDILEIMDHFTSLLRYSNRQSELMCKQMDREIADYKRRLNLYIKETLK